MPMKSRQNGKTKLVLQYGEIVGTFFLGYLGLRKEKGQAMIVARSGLHFGKKK